MTEIDRRGRSDGRVQHPDPPSLLDTPTTTTCKSIIHFWALYDCDIMISKAREHKNVVCPLRVAVGQKLLKWKLKEVRCGSVQNITSPLPVCFRPLVAALFLFCRLLRVSSNFTVVIYIFFIVTIQSEILKAQHGWWHAYNKFKF